MVLRDMRLLVGLIIYYIFVINIDNKSKYDIIVIVYFVFII